MNDDQWARRTVREADRSVRAIRKAGRFERAAAQAAAALASGGLRTQEEFGSLSLVPGCA